MTSSLNMCKIVSRGGLRRSYAFYAGMEAKLMEQDEIPMINMLFACAGLCALEIWQDMFFSTWVKMVQKSAWL
ncbi:hypothetical protein SLEP1_g457 [Rubroshorea leprosula]|uniref:Uncharacterized protein n=1 Tax=Rubroshorea leprosula TaxID=152421 RepID=A0AAV5HLG8_9ROSI|nr:hypothetical protein SLEP1_g457 [Rubroshorea leprosula]